MTLRVLDAHVHYWQPRTSPRKATPLLKLFGWLPDGPARAAKVLVPPSQQAFVGDTRYVLTDHLPADAMLDGVDWRGAVHVEAAWQARGTRLADETAWLDSLDPAPLGIVAAAQLQAKRLDAVLDAHARSPRFVGVRHKLARHPARGVMSWARRDFLSDPAWERGYARLGERGLTFDAWMYDRQLPAFAALATRHPDTRVVLDHAGTPVGLFGPHGGLGTTASERDRIEGDWKRSLEAVAALPHVHVKLSGLTMPVCGWSGPVGRQELMDTLVPHLRWVLETFGRQRCLFASNFPMDKVTATLPDLLAVTREAAGDDPDVFAGNATRFYGLDGDAGAP
jgi:L-fuconolactonase